MRSNLTILKSSPSPRAPVLQTGAFGSNRLGGIGLFQWKGVGHERK